MLRTAIVLLTAGTLTFAATTVPAWFQDMPAPTQEHIAMQKTVGEWEGTVTMFMPGMPATPVPATETVSANGPFWITSDFQSVFMGMPYEGHGCHGYSPELGKYRGIWIDSFSSYLSVMEGEHDADKNAIVMKWEAPNMMGEITPMSSVQTLGKDAYTMTFFEKDEKVMLIDMKRVKATKAVEAMAK